MRRSESPIPPVRRERELPLDPDHAFELFTAGMGSWWPMATHAISGAEGDVRFEGHVGGCVVEIAADGTEAVWAQVLTWDPPHRVVLAWHPNPQPLAASTLDVRFSAAPSGTRMHLEHRDWEEFGAIEGARLRASYDSGWDTVLAGYERLSARTG